ncbi:MAG: potassium channel protein [Leptolyngbyaceae cyanobacterium bins.59]|nr:potassium channel protein [Leptolyngbyaceae cyanobacterium bins.59]
MSDPKYQRITAELTSGVGALVGIFLVGTLWYGLAEGWPWLDAAYMTAITLATVGFMEVHPLSDGGRIFTIFLIITGVINIGYIVNRFTLALIDGHFQQERDRRKQRRMINSLSNHYLICGFGRMGRQVALEFQAEKIPFVVIDSQLEPTALAERMGLCAVQGDATLDVTLLQLGIERASCLIAALPSDAENLYTILSAKTLNPAIRAIARASNEEAVQKLRRAGADAVVSPYITGGKRMAAAALRPQVIDFVDGILSGPGREFLMEEVLIDPVACPHVGQTLRGAKLRSQTGALIVAIRRADGTLISGPTAETVLKPGDVLISMGTADQLRKLNQILSR